MHVRNSYLPVYSGIVMVSNHSEHGVVRCRPFTGLLACVGAVLQPLRYCYGVENLPPTKNTDTWSENLLSLFDRHDRHQT